MIAKKEKSTRIKDVLKQNKYQENFISKSFPKIMNNLIS